LENKNFTCAFCAEFWIFSEVSNLTFWRISSKYEFMNFCREFRGAGLGLRSRVGIFCLGKFLGDFEDVSIGIFKGMGY
jgi:hypothetical protein